MHYVSLQADSLRTPMVCSYNRHRCVCHSDRIIGTHDMIYLLSGQWEIWQDGEPFLMGPGSLLFLFAGHHHYGLRPGSEDVRTVYAHLPLLVGDRLDTAPARGDGAFTFPMFLPAAPEKTEELISRAADAFWDHAPYSVARSGAWLSLLFSELSSPYFTPAEDGSGALVERLMRSIAASPDRFYSVEELSRMAGVCRKTLNSYFVRHTGLTPHAYQVSEKLRCIRLRLEEDPSLTLRSLAEQYGFCDEYQVSKLYKKAFGVSPRGDRLPMKNILFPSDGI